MSGDSPSGAPTPPVFHPYPKIADSLSGAERDEATARRHAKGTWVATEKIHGANLCVWGDGHGLRVGKRRRLLEPGETFFDHYQALGPLYAALDALIQSVQATHAARAVLLHGELFGGAYPHPEVEPVQGVAPVQTGVHYCPDVRFAAFDVAVVTEDDERRFLPLERAFQHLEDASIPTVPILSRGPLDEMLALPADFLTRVPAQLGLPELADNFAEGLVIRPWDLEPTSPAARPLFKRKRAAFVEARYHAAEAWAAAPPPDPLDALEQAALAMLDQNRVASALSKVGRDDGSDARHRELVLELSADLRRELETHHGAMLLALAPDERALLFTVLEDACGDNLRRGPLDPARYFVELAHAFIRGRLDRDASPAELVLRAREAELSLHKFKRKDGPPRVMDVLARLEGIRPASLLDVGSGRGAFLWPLLDRFPELPVTAIDRLEHRVGDIEAARRGGITRLRGALTDVTALPFDDRSFDVVTILEVLEHLERPETAAREVLRVADRFVVASVPSHEDDNPEHIQLFTRDTLTELLMTAGAAQVTIDYVRGHMVAVARVAARSPDG